MKRQTASNLEKRLDNKFEKIEKLLKLMDQKNINTENRLALRITAEIIRAGEQIERDFEAQLQVANSELEGRLSGKFTRIENTLSEVEKRLNKRITDVGDLITIYFGKKTKVLDKRVAHLEQMQQAA